MKDIYKTIGRNLRNFREQRGLTIDDVSYTSKVSRSSIYRIELGQVDCKISTLEKLAKAIGIELWKLFKE